MEIQDKSSGEMRRENNIDILTLIYDINITSLKNLRFGSFIDHKISKALCCLQIRNNQ